MSHKLINHVFWPVFCRCKLQNFMNVQWPATSSARVATTTRAMLKIME